MKAGKRASRVVIALFMVISGMAVAMSMSGPASAYTQCNLHERDYIVERVCQVESSRIGGRVHGAIYWEFKRGPLGQKGKATLMVRDRTADSKCTWLKIQYRDYSANPNPNENWRRKVCGGNRRYFELDLNEHNAGNGPVPVATKGWLYVKHCSGRKNCITVWKQNIAKRRIPG